MKKNIPAAMEESTSVEGSEEMRVKKKKKRKSETGNTSGTVEKQRKSEMSDGSEINLASIAENATSGTPVKRKRKKKLVSKEKKRDTNFSTDIKDSITSQNDVCSEQSSSDKVNEKTKTKKKKKKSNKSDEADDSGKTDKQAETAALEYLKKWKYEKSSWNFQKVRQTWLLKNIYSSDKISTENFSILLEYLEGLKGHSRTLTVQQAQNIIDKNDGDEDKSDGDEEQTGKEVVADQCSRAKEVIQLLID